MLRATLSFVHAGIDEDSGNAWEYCTEDYIFTEQYPHRLGKIHGLDKKGGGRACPHQQYSRRPQI